MGRENDRPMANARGKNRPFAPGRIIREFPRQYTKADRDLREACRKNEGEHLRREAHTLRGASLNMGANGIAEVCRRLETEPLDMAAELSAQLSSEFDRVRPAIERELKGVRNGSMNSNGTVRNRGGQRRLRNLILVPGTTRCIDIRFASITVLPCQQSLSRMSRPMFIRR